MATKLRTLGWTTWIVVLIVVLLIVVAGLLYLAYGVLALEFQPPLELDVRRQIVSLSSGS